MTEKGSFSINASSKEKKESSQTVVSPPSGTPKHWAPLSWPWALGVLIALLILPVWAALVLIEKIDWRFLATYFGVISGLTLIFYWSDKRKAQHEQWRIPEGTLHLLELLGGWPAALLGQRFLRHKTKKRGYQVLFWLIVAIHQLFSFEVVSGWWLSRSILQAFL